MLQNLLITSILLCSFLVGTIAVDKVRHGTSVGYNESIHTIGVVDSKIVYKSIPEYIKIQNEGIQKGSAKYYNLMKKATDRYHSALKRTAKAGGYYVLVEIGGVEGYHTTNVTKACISNL